MTDYCTKYKNQIDDLHNYVNIHKDSSQNTWLKGY